jgi:hypothetical protein
MSGFLDTQTRTNQIETLYIADFDRAADGPGADYWVNTDTHQAVQIAQSFVVQPEAAALGIPTDNTNTTAVAAFIQAIYGNLFAHAADAAGLAYWQGQITSGAVSLGAATYIIANGATGNDQTVLADKITAALFFTNKTFANNLGTRTPLDSDFLTHAHNAVVNVVDDKTLATSESDTNHYVTFFLTTGVDTVDATHLAIFGTAGGSAQTFTGGDHITGTPGSGQTVLIQITDSLLAPGAATIDGTDLIDLQVAASNNQVSTTNGGFNALFWGQTTAVGTVSVTPEAQNTVTAINNAPIATTYALNAPGNNAALYVGFRSGGAGSFSIDSGVSPSTPGLLDATGSTLFANGLANALTSATIAAAGTNWDTINLGINDHLITLTGTGLDTFSFGPLPTTGGLDIEFPTTTNNQLLTFQTGALNTNTGNAVTIHGGLGANDSVTANGMTGTEALTMSGVENLVTTFVGANMVFDGANVLGLTTMTVNGAVQPGANDTFNNMHADFTLNINGPVQTVVFNAIGPAGSLTVNFGGNDAAIAFAGLRVSDIATLTVNFNDAAGFTVGSAVGEIVVDPVLTTSLTVNNQAPGAIDFVALSGAAALTDLMVIATDAGSTMHVTDFLFPIVINVAGANVNIVAPAFESTAWLSGIADLSAFNTVNVLAEDSHSTAFLGPDSIHALPFAGDHLSTLGGVNQINVEATGTSAFADLVHFDVGASIGSINVAASGDGSLARIDTVSIVHGSVQTIDVTASGTHSLAVLDTIDPLSIGTVNVTASGVESTAGIADLFRITGNVSAIDVTASDTSSFAAMICPGPTLVSAGDLNTVNVTASGAGSTALLIFADANTIQTVAVTASETGSLAIAVLDPLSIGTVVVLTGALGNGTPDFALSPNPPFTPPALLVSDSFFGFKGGTESTAVLSLGDVQATNGGTVNASGAGFFDIEQTAHGGFTVNATNTGGFAFFVGFSGFTDDHLLTTNITSSSDFNFVQAGVEQTLISTGMATGTSTPGHLQGNTFEMATAVNDGPGVDFDPFGLAGAGVTSAAQFLSITGGAANETIKAGFTTSGINAFQAQGQLTLGQGSGVAGNGTTTGNYATDVAASSDALVTDALALFAAYTNIKYVVANTEGNSFVAVQGSGVGAGHVVQVVELVGSTVTAHDIFA